MLREGVVKSEQLGLTGSTEFMATKKACVRHKELNGSSHIPQVVDI